MTTVFAYLPQEESPYLLACWLRTLPADARVTLLVDALWSDLESAGPERHAAIEAVQVIAPGATPPAAFRDAIDQANGVVHVPVSLDRVPMRFRAGALMPDVAPHYEMIRGLWPWGFREIVFVDHAGATALSIPNLLDGLHNRHRGERCFVVGNGPSLNAIDMTKLQGEITLGSNRCFLGYAQWGFPFTYWGVYDQFQIEEYHHVYEEQVPVETLKFFPIEYLPVLRVANGCPVNSRWPDPAARAFSDDPARVYRGFTVTFMLLQIAAIMGCDPIILIGADHRYELTQRGYSRWLRSARRSLARQMRGGRVYATALAAQRAWKKGGTTGAPSLWTTSDAASPTHFTTSYTDGGKNRFLPPEPEEAERDFDCAQQWARACGRRILNATPGTALESFPKTRFEDLFRVGF